MPSREWYAARQAEKLRAHQAALPPEQRIINRTDWDDAVERKVSVLTSKAREKAKQLFISIASGPNVGNTPQEAEKAYFRRAGKRFTDEVLRRFVKAIATTRNGTKLEIPSVRSIKQQVTFLCSAATAAGNPVERNVKADILLWIDGPLLTQGVVRTTAREKPTPLPQDITAFLRSLFDCRFMITLPTTRDILLIALFICLQVDCSSRASELLGPSLPKENLIAYSTEHKEKTFSWSSVEVLAIKHQETGQVSLEARLSFHGIMGVQKKGFRLKTIPLRLLPATHAAEDSLFWLMILGLIDGVFEGVSSWSDIDRLQPGPNGQIIPIKSSMQDVPVFRASTSKPSAQNDLVSKMQMDERSMRTHLHKLSQSCGLKHAILPYVLRRRSAYIDEDYTAGERSDVAQRAKGGTFAASNGGPSEGLYSVTREVAGHSLVNDVPTYLYGQPPGGATWGELSGIFVDVFNHMHPANRFYPNQEPLPGTYECRFCGLDFITAVAGGKEAAAHSQLCGAERLA